MGERVPTHFENFRRGIAQKTHLNFWLLMFDHSHRDSFFLKLKIVSALYTTKLLFVSECIFPQRYAQNYPKYKISAGI